jgi:TonB family protein
MELRFTVKQDGTLEKVEVTQNLHPDLDQEAVRILQSTSGKWEPAQADGKPVPSEVSLLLPASAFTPLTFGEPREEKIYTWVDKMPSFEGGPPGLKDFLKTNLSAAGPKGLVVLTFIIRKNGRLEDIEVIKSLSPAQDAESLRVVRLMEGKWKPGQERGKNVDVRYTLPVRYE